MSDEENSISAAKSKNDIELQIINEVYEAGFEKAQLVVVRHLQSLNSEYKDTELELFLQSFWNYYEATRLIREEGNFLQAVGFAESAVTGFRQLGLNDLEASSLAISAYGEAIVELRKLNVARFLELHASIEDYLRKAGRFGQKLQPMIDHMKPESEFVGGIQALQVGDFDTAKTLMSKASMGSEMLAKKYYEEGTPMYCTYLGLGRLYTAFLTYFVAQNDLNNLEFDHIASSTDISASAKEAEQLLAKADLQNSSVLISYHLSKALIEILDVTRALSSDLHRCLKSTFKTNDSGFTKLRKKTRLAIEYASSAGPNAVPLVRTCEQLLIRIKNFERLSIPNKADFGIYSGLIACALFIPLFAISSYINKVAELGLEASVVLSTMLGLSLIGGFGFGALKFKGFISSRFKIGEDA